MVYFALLLGTPIVIYCALVLAATLFQRKLQYFPSHRDSAKKGNREFKAWKSSDNEFLGYQKLGRHAKQVVVHFHGNKGEALDKSWISELFDEDENHLFLAEYPGFGSREGILNEKNIYSACERALEELVKTFPGLPILAMGESLGSSVACKLASGNSKVSRLALVSAFPSAEKIGQMMYPYFPVKWFMKDKFQTKVHLEKCSQPVCFIHATLDATAPVEWVRQLYENYKGKKDLVEIPGYDHHNLYSAILDSPLADRFREFLKP